MSELQGSLKEQCLDNSGRFEWIRKNLVLDRSRGIISEIHDEKLVNPRCITAARCAKPWAYSSALAGFGFDLVWPDKSTWSFLVDNEEMCQLWVDAINSSLHGQSASDKSHHQHSISNNKSQVFSDPHNNDYLRQSNQSSLILDHTNSLDSKFETSNLPPLKPSRSHDFGDSREHHQFGGIADQPTSANLAEILEFHKQQAQKHEKILHQSQVEDEAAILRSRCQFLEKLVDRKQMEHELTNKQVLQLQDELKERTLQLNKQQELAKEKEKALLNDSQNELDMRVLRISNENSNFYEAALKSSQLQHQRELNCLKEELAAERKRFTALLAKETQSKTHIETSEQQLKHDINQLQEKIFQLQLEYTQAKEQYQQEQTNWNREKIAIMTEYSTKIHHLELENKTLVTNTQTELKEKVKELTIKYEKSVKLLKENEMEALKQELEGEKLTFLNELQKKCQLDIESVRNEERKRHYHEIETLKREYLYKEQAISKDLLELESLHSKRILQLETQIDTLRKQNILLDEKSSHLEYENNIENQSMSNKSHLYRKHMEEVTKQAEKLSQQLLILQNELNTTKLREKSYREQLSKALEDNKIKTSELFIAKQHLSEGNIEATQWKKVSRESEINLNATETSLQIARDEIYMLENEIKRLRDENQTLKTELLYADKLIFGIPQHQSDRRTFIDELETSRPCLYQHMAANINNNSNNGNGKGSDNHNNHHVNHTIIDQNVSSNIPYNTSLIHGGSSSVKKTGGVGYGNKPAMSRVKSRKSQSAGRNNNDGSNYLQSFNKSHISLR